MIYHITSLSMELNVFSKSMKLTALPSFLMTCPSIILSIQILSTENLSDLYSTCISFNVNIIHSFQCSFGYFYLYNGNIIDFHFSQCYISFFWWIYNYWQTKSELTIKRQWRPWTAVEHLITTIQTTCTEEKTPIVHNLY